MPKQRYKWYYLTHRLGDKRVHSISKGICTKVNVIAHVEFEPVYYAITPLGFSLTVNYTEICRTHETFNAYTCNPYTQPSEFALQLLLAEKRYHYNCKWNSLSLSAHKFEVNVSFSPHSRSLLELRASVWTIKFGAYLALHTIENSFSPKQRMSRLQYIHNCQIITCLICSFGYPLLLTQIIHLYTWKPKILSLSINLIYWYNVLSKGWSISTDRLVHRHLRSSLDFPKLKLPIIIKKYRFNIYKKVILKSQVKICSSKIF